MPKAREGGEHERGIPPSHKGGFGRFTLRKFLNYRRLYVRFTAFSKFFGGGGWGGRILVILAKNLASLT